jgi:RimJ/RimL family protein N-acetyltransferase
MSLATLFQSCRLVYRAVEEDDTDKAFIRSLRLDTAAMAQSDRRLMRPPNREHTNDLVKFFSKEALLGVMICLPASSDAPATPVGYIALTQKEPLHHRTATIGLNIAAEEQRRGYGSEAIRWMLKWAFEMAGLHRVAIGCFSYNPGAQRLYERLGFVLEGRERESLWFNGGWHDIINFSMLDGEWREKCRVEDGKAEAFEE